MESKKLSVIIPAYNAAGQLRAALDSVVSQLPDDGSFEVLIIDDGSTDDTPAICDEYAAHYPLTVRVFHTENQGVSAARNRGIREARGEWLHFVDADDLVVAGAYNAMLQIEGVDEADYIGCNVRIIDLRDRGEAETPEPFDGEIKMRERVLGREWLQQGYIPSYVFAGLYRREFVQSRGMMFDEEMSLSEDAEFNLRFIALNPRVIKLANFFYWYYFQANSATTSMSKTRFAKWRDSYKRLLLTFRSLVERDEALYPVFIKFNDSQLVTLTAKVLAFGIEGAQFRAFAEEYIASGFLPTSGTTQWLRFINYLYSHPGQYPLLSFIYRRVFLKLVYPLYRVRLRNR